MNLWALVQRLIFQDCVGGHFGFCPLEKNAGIFGRDRGAYFFKKVHRSRNNRQTILARQWSQNWGLWPYYCVITRLLVLQSGMSCPLAYNVVSASFMIHNGTRQGSVLSPYLVSRYIRDILGVLWYRMELDKGLSYLLIWSLDISETCWVQLQIPKSDAR